jgi:DHA1 family inner membrane transport protein
LKPTDLASKNSLRVQVPVITLVRTVLNTMHRMVYPFLGVFQDGLGVSLGALSLAVTVRSLGGALSPFMASIADSRSRKTGMLLGLGMFIVGAGLVVFRPTYPVFFLALLLTGLGKTLFDPTIMAYMGDRVPYHRRGFAISITEFGWSLSFIAGVPLMGFLISRRGWMAPFPLLAILGVISFIGLAWLLPNEGSSVSNRSGLTSNFRSVFTYKPALAGLSMGVLFSSANEVVNLVFGVWMEDSFGLKIAALGAASAVIGLSELEGLASWLPDRLGKPRAVGLGIVANSLAALALPLIGRSVTGAVVGLFFFYITFELTIVSSLPMLTEILPGARATLMGTNVAGFSVGRAIGAVLSAPLYSLGLTLSASSGIVPGATAAILLNTLALLALRILQRSAGLTE